MPNPGQLPSHPFDGTPGGFPYRDHHRGGTLVSGDPGFTVYGGTPDLEPGDDGDGPPPLVIPAPLPPCAPPPQIIQVGRGMAQHHPKTRVVYGMPPCGYP